MAHTDGRVIRGKGKTRRRRTWRDTPDEIICSAQARPGKDGHLHWAPVARAESLSPDDATLERAVLYNDPRAQAILLAWRFTVPVTKIQEIYQTI